MGSCSLHLIVGIPLLLGPGTLLARSDESAQVTQRELTIEMRAEEVRKELSSATYTARRNLPMSEGLFVENGRLIEELFAFNSLASRPAVTAGEPATVWKVVLMTKAVQVFFKERFAVIVMTEGDRETKDMTTPQLVSLARRGLGTVLQIKPGEQKSKLPT
jgi:hypothetical protein